MRFLLLRWSLAGVVLVCSAGTSLADERPAMTPSTLKANSHLEDEVILARLKKDIFYLAGEECEGRGMKTKGLIKAGEYIATAFKEAGLAPGGKESSYFQPFSFGGGGKVQPGAALVLTGPDNKKLDLKHGIDFQATTASKTGKVTADLVFVGYGIKAPPLKYDDFADLDVKGKFLIVLRRTPRADDTKNPFDKNNQYAPLAAKVRTAAEQGAAGLIFVSDLGTAGTKDDLFEEGRAGSDALDGPVVHVKRAVIDQLLAGSKKALADIEKEIDESGKPQSFELKGWSAASDITIKRQEYNTRNVIGVLDGAGPLKDETVVVGAHYDHLGRGDEGDSLDRAPGGKIHYGADDNASGTAGLLELARRFGAIKNRQGRRLVFIAFSGEEKGLKGSQFYVRNPSFPLEKTIFMLNMDMIGRMIAVEDKDKVSRDRLLIYGTGTAVELDKLVDEITKPFDFKLTKIPGGIGPSDHTSFYVRKIPVLFFFTGTHADYHKPTDIPDRINLGGMKKLLDLGELFLKHFANVEKPPVYKDVKGGAEDPTRTSFAAVPRIGIMPGNYGEMDGGVLVEAVSKDGPADKAGIKVGDRIVEINGKEVKNMDSGKDSYMNVMGQQKPGEEIPLVIIRKDQKLTVKVKPNPPLK